MLDHVIRSQANCELSYIFRREIPPQDLDETLVMRLNSYDPLFRKFIYSSQKDTITGFFCYFQFDDLIGYRYYYDDKDGEFRLLKNNSFYEKHSITHFDKLRKE